MTSFALGQSSLAEREFNFDEVFTPNTKLKYFGREYFFDRSNILWISDGSKGVIEYDGYLAQKHTFPGINVYNADQPFQFGQYGDREIVSLFKNGRLIIYDPQFENILELTSPESQYRIIENNLNFDDGLMSEMSNGNLFVFSPAFSGYLEIKSNEDSISLKTEPLDGKLISIIRDYKIKSIYKGKDDQFWAISDQDIIGFRLNEMISYSYIFLNLSEFSDKNFELKHIYQNEKKGIWISTFDSVSFDPALINYNIQTENFQLLDVEVDNLKNESWITPDAYDVEIDSLGNLWWLVAGHFIRKYELISDENGHAIGKQYRISTNSKFPSEYYTTFTFNLFQDNYKTIWINTERGLLKYVPEKPKMKITYMPNNGVIRRIINLSDSIQIVPTSNKTYIHNNKSKSFEQIFNITDYPQILDKIRYVFEFYYCSKDVFLFLVNNSSELFKLDKKAGLSSIAKRSDGCIWDVDFNNQVWVVQRQPDSSLSLRWEDPITGRSKLMFYDSLPQTLIARVDSNTLLGFSSDELKLIKLSVTFSDGFPQIDQIKKLPLNFGIKEIKISNDHVLFLTPENRFVEWDLTNDCPIEYNLDLLPDGVQDWILLNDSILWIDDFIHRQIYSCNTNTGVCLNKTELIGNTYKPLIPVSDFSNTTEGKIIIPMRGKFFTMISDEKSYNSQPQPQIIKLEWELGDNSKFSQNRHELELKKEMSLPYNFKRLTIHYSNCYLKNSSHETFKYFLEGRESTWSTPTKSSSTSYTSLNPGKYTFKVIASDGNGQWSDHEASFKFRVFAPWYWSWWSKIIYAGILGFLIYRLYLFSLIRQQEKQEADKIRAIDEVRKNMYTNITHEFRTPLTVIQGMADEIIELLPERQSKRIGDKLQLIKRNGDDLLILVNQMLDIDKIESRHYQLQPVQTNVIPFLHYLTDSFSSLAVSRQLNLTFYAELSDLVMDHDPEALRKVIYNLISNAIKYTPKGGEIICHVNSIFTTKEYCQIKIKDTGIGIPVEEQKKVFERFYAIDDSIDGQFTSTGIGLSLTKELVELMGGTIDIQSTPGTGTEVTIRIPVTREATPDNEKEYKSNGKLEKELESVFIPIALAEEVLPLVLIVEDNRDVASYVAMCLRRSYRIIHAVDGQEGIEKAREELPDLIISDVMMPRADGYELTRILKTDERTAHIPVILLTAKATQDDKVSGLEYGADAYLVKPFNKKELLVRIEKLIDLRKKIWAHYAQPDQVTGKKGKSENLNDSFVQKAIDIINSHLDDTDFGQEQLSAELHLSSSQVYRKLKALTGKSPANFIRWVRLQHAVILLESSGKTVSEVAYACGFNNLAWFSRAFKEEFGYPPSAVIR